MRIVLDLQGAQGDGRFRRSGHETLSLALAIARNRGEHEVMIALNGLFPDSIEPVRALFDGLLPQENIRVWHAPGPIHGCEAGRGWRREVAECIREAFLAGLRPDIVHVSTVFEGYGDDVVTSIGTFAPWIPTTVMLHDLFPQTYLDLDPAYARHHARQTGHLNRAVAWLALPDEMDGIQAMPGIDSRRRVECLDHESAGRDLPQHGADHAGSPVWDARARRAISIFEKVHASAVSKSNASQENHEELHSRLIETIAAISCRENAESDLEHISRAIAISLPGEREKQFFIDVSGVVQEDAKTGIQRVTRSILKELIDNPPFGYTVEPVYAAANRMGYCYARHYVANLLNQDCAGEDEAIDYCAGDIFLGLDLQHRVLIAQHEFLKGLQRDGVKVFFVVYDLLPILMPHAFALEQDIHRTWLETITDFDGAACISRAVADELSEWLAENGRQRIRPYHIDWFHLGADIENSVPTFGLPPDADKVLRQIARVPGFLMVGTVEPRKGHQQTLEAFERLWSRGIDVNLVIVGKEGWKVDRLVERLRHHPEQGKRLFWLMGISDEYLEKVYAASACLIAASEGEGFGLPLIEAARHKLPILARGIPVFREIAGEHASYFDGLDPDALASAIEEWLATAAAGQTLQSSGMRWLTWVESAEQLKRAVCLPSAIKAHYPLRDAWYDAQHPDVSLIVLNYNKPAMTLACMDSLWEHTCGYRYEIVLVDNGSEPKNFRKLAPAQTGARILRLESNRFFGEGNNIGFEASRGRYVVFLNNDITATAGWLAPLIRRLEENPDIGAAGPKMISPDNRLQEAGAEIRIDGSDNRYGRGADPDDPAHASQRDVMYISAAALAMRRETFEQVLGFDLYYEPAYYEDVDLCLKIRQLGLRVTYCPDACIVHHENATSSEYAGQLKLGSLIPLNRQRFLTRWRPVLAGEADGVPDLIPPLAPPLRQRADRPSVLLYTPYNLVPGGGERYLLTIAAGLSEVANVTLATLHPYSRLRLRTMGRELSLDLDAVRIATLEQAVGSAVYEVSIVMGNEALPGIPGRARHNYYICQFPFPAPQPVLEARKEYAGDYQQVVVYSPFVQRHYTRALQDLDMSLPAIRVVSPPAVLAAGGQQDGGKKAMVLGVGRFINAGHAKRQDLMIEAFRLLAARRPEAELHLAGSLPAEGEFRAYYAELQGKAEGLRIFFHPNASPQQLAQLYADASLYWHLAGYGVDEQREPHRCEHFGITVVEAMSAACIPLVVNRGGPPEIVRDGVTGHVFETLEELVETSARILSLPPGDAGIQAMRAAAVEDSRRFSPENFIAEFLDLTDLQAPSPPAPPPHVGEGSRTGMCA